jgi:hypothetical protein
MIEAMAAGASPAVPTGIPTGVPTGAVLDAAQNHSQAVMQLDVATILAIAAFLISVGTLVWKSSALAAQQRAFEVYSTKRDTEREEWRKAHEASVDTRFAALTATSTLLREQIGELRERLASNYMTKAEIAAIETRATNGQERIFTMLDKMNARLDSLSEKVLQALQK